MDQDTFMKSVMKYQAALVAYAYARLGDYHSADDTVQDALIVLMRKWADFTPDTNVYAFARQIVRYKTLEALRARRKREPTLAEQELEAAVDRTLDEGLDEEAAIRHNEMVYALQNCLTRLSGKALDLVNGFYRDSKSYRELARIHSLSLAAIKKALYRYRKLLQDCVVRQLRRMETA